MTKIITSDDSESISDVQQSLMAQHTAQYGAKDMLFPDTRPTRAGGCHTSAPRRRQDAMRLTTSYLNQKSHHRDRYGSIVEFLQRCLVWLVDLWDRNGLSLFWQRLDKTICEMLSRYFHSAPLMLQDEDEMSEKIKREDGVSDSSWNIGMAGSNYMKAPEIDPYESWWNGKVSLFEFMRYLVRDYLYSSNLKIDLFPKGQTHLSKHQDLESNKIEDVTTEKIRNYDSDNILAMLQRNTLFEFRILRVNPYNLIKEEKDLVSAPSASYSFVTSTDSPRFALLLMMILIHYLYLVFRPSSPPEPRKLSRTRRISMSYESDFISQTKEKLPASHVYVRDAEVDDDELTCSEAGDCFDPVPLPRKALPIFPPLLQHESIASTDGDDNDVLPSFHANNIPYGNDGLPSYLKTPFSPGGHHSIDTSFSNVDQPPHIPQAMPFTIDDSVTTATAPFRSLNYFICFVTEVTEVTNDRSADDIERGNLLNIAHNDWLEKMQQAGVVLASGSYVGSPNRNSKADSSKDGMMIIKAKNYEHAQDIAMGDPYHQHCVCTFRIMPWNISNTQNSDLTPQTQIFGNEDSIINEAPPGFNESIHLHSGMDDSSTISKARSTPEFPWSDSSLDSCISKALSAPERVDILVEKL